MSLHSHPLPFFLKSSLCNSPDLKYINAFSVKNDYYQLIDLKKSNNFNEILPNQISNQCVNCKALFSPSYLKSESNLEWQCPFCSSENKLNIESPNFPINVYFPQKKIENSWEKKLLFVICLDYSGSMNCNYFRSSQMENMVNLLNNGRTYEELETNHLVSRKNLVIEALDSFLDNLLMNSQQFDIRVFLILFNNEVKLLGDCRSPPETISGHDLNKFEECLKRGRLCVEKLCSSRFDAVSKKKIVNTLKSIDPDYSTALGPAIAAGLGVIETFVRDLDFYNSSFFVFTDGKSNTGIGNLDVLDKKGEKIIDQKVYQESVKHYEAMNEIALKYYFPFHFTTFDDEVSLTKVFKNSLLKRMNGNLFQIPVKEEKLGIKKYVFCQDTELEDHLAEIYTNIFTSKLLQISIYQSPGSELKFFKKNDVHIEKKKINNSENFIIRKKTCYSIGEPTIGIYSEYRPEVESKGKLDFQIRLEFFSLTEELSEVFISSFSREFCNEEDLKKFDQEGANICKIDLVKFLIRLQDKKNKKDPQANDKKSSDIIEMLKEYMKYYRKQLVDKKKLEEKKNNNEENKGNVEEEEEEEEEEQKGNQNEGKYTQYFGIHQEKKDRKSESDSESESDEDEADLGNDKKTTILFWKERTDLHYKD